MMNPAHPPPPRGWRSLLIVFGLVAVVALGIGIYRGVTSAGDLRTRYEEWQVLTGRGEIVDRRVVPEQERTGWFVPYHPATYLALAPLFACGFTPAKLVFLVINLACLGYVWRRVVGLTGLNRWQATLVAALFCSWGGVRVTLGSGQFGLMWLAVILAAHPFRTWGQSGWLALGILKHNLVFPLWAYFAVRRPRQLVVPLAVAVMPVGLAMWWLGADGATFFARSHLEAAKMMTWQGGTDVGIMLGAFLDSAGARYAVIGTVWVAGMVLVGRVVRDELVLLAILPLMSLWPVYHRSYDFVVALPALALFVKHLPLPWSVGLSVMLWGAPEFLSNRQFLPEQWLGWYYPFIVFALLAGLFVVNAVRAGGREGAGDIPAATSRRAGR